MKIFTGSSNPILAQKIAENIKLKLGKIELSKFPNGECRVWIKEKTEGEICIVVQSFSHPVNDHIVEFLLITDALYRMGARKIFAVIPWIGYSPQDKVFRLGEPLSAKVVGSIISGSLVDRIFTFDIHNESISGFFSKPLEQLTGNSLFIQYARKNIDLAHAVVISPDMGAVKRSSEFAEKLRLDHAIINKQRDKVTGKVIINGINGPVKNKTCLVFDDFISTGQTAIFSALKLKEWGAKSVIFCATHHFDVPGVSRQLQQSLLDKIIISDSILVKNPGQYSKLKILETAGTISQNLKPWIA